MSDKQRAKTAIAHELADRGWKLYGYHADQSDMMSDCYCPAYWEGVATKDGYVLCVGIYGNGNSGKEITTQPVRVDYAKVAKLQALADDAGATEDERAAAQGRIDALRQRAADSVQVLDTWPSYQGHPGSASWHLEKDGAILAKGAGVYSLFDWNEREQTRRNVSAFVDKVEKAMTSGAEVVAETVEVRKPIKRVQDMESGSLSVGQVIRVKARFTGGIYPGAFECVRMIGEHFIFARLNKKLTATMSGNTAGNEMWLTSERFEKLMSQGAITWAQVVDDEEITTKTVYRTRKRTEEARQALTASDEAAATCEVSAGLEVSVNYNTERGGIELTFADKPDEATREQLKAHGFRWSRNQGIWYARDNETRRAYVRTLTDAEATETAEPATYPDIDINDLHTYTVDHNLQAAEHSGHWLFRSSEPDRTSEIRAILGAKQTEVEELLTLTEDERLRYRLKKTLQSYKRRYYANYIARLRNRANNPSWVVTGRAGRNLRRDQKSNDRYDNLMRECIQIDKDYDNAIYTLRNLINREKVERTRQQAENTDAGSVEFVTGRRQITLVGYTETCRTYEAGPYYIAKCWGCFRIFKDGHEVHSMRTTDTLTAAKQYVCMLLAQDATQEVTTC